MVSYNVRKLISLPSSGGMTPENWFASSILFQIFVINTQDYWENVNSGLFRMRLFKETLDHNEWNKLILSINESLKHTGMWE